MPYTSITTSKKPTLRAISHTNLSYVKALFSTPSYFDHPKARKKSSTFAQLNSAHSTPSAESNTPSTQSSLASSPLKIDASHVPIPPLRPLTIIHLITQDNGGAGKACLRLHEALLNEGVNSLVLTQRKTTHLSSVLQLASSKKDKLISYIRPHLSALPLLAYPNRQKDIFSPNLPFFTPHNSLLLDTIKHLRPDVIHAHWIEGYFGISDLAQISTPILWSLHDACAYTGGCHYVAAACVGAKTSCASCPLLNSAFPYDVSFWTFKRKKRAYARMDNLTINGLSRWIANEVRASSLLANKPIINLPNPIDISLYRPIPKDKARALLRIDTKKFIIGFGALGGASVKRKGFAELQHALSLLPSSIKDTCALLVFGGEAQGIIDMPMYSLGFLHDDIALALAYNACNIFVAPSLAENLSNAIMEALSCGVPVACFDIGGNADMVKHQHNGYLARDALDLANGIKWLYHALESHSISHNARASVMRFESSRVARDYIRAYKQLIAVRGGAEI